MEKKEKRLLRGFRDIYGKELERIVRVEGACKSVAREMGVEEIRLPLLESADLYKRAVGEDSDIVSKEFYDFTKGDRHICLRPEGTAGCMRAYMEGPFRHSNGFMPKSFWYMGSMFRYERPQKGRYREFSQFGVEFFNYDTANDILLIIGDIFIKLNILDKVVLHINNLGSTEDRVKYKKELCKYLKNHKNEFTETEWEKIVKNPLRLFDSKDEKVIDILEDAPKISEFVSSTDYMQKIGAFKRVEIDPKLVRGLDYYNGLVFEWKIKGTDKSQNTICGGGQYDGLARQLGYPSVNAVGFALGIERVAEMLDDESDKEKKLENKGD